MFGHDNASCMRLNMPEVQFYGSMYPVLNGAAIRLRQHDICRILWELAEMNWCYELYALDRTAAKEEWMKVDADIDRTHLVERVFGPTRFITVSLWPDRGSLVVHSNNLYWVGTLHELRHLMLSWPQCPTSMSVETFDVELPDNFYTTTMELNVVMCDLFTHPHILQLENEVHIFCCQSFSNSLVGLLCS